MSKEGRRAVGWPSFLALMILGPSPLGAGPGAWTSSGPWGGQIWTLAIDPTDPAVIYAGTDLNGVFKTTDGGTTWSRASEGIQNENGSPPGYDNALVIKALAIVPGAPDQIYAATFSGIFKTTDGGQSWLPLAESQINVGTYSVAVALPAPETVYLGTSVGVFKSTDGGDTWEPASNGLGAGNVIALAIDPTAAETAYAVVEEGVFKTTNGAVGWQKASAGLPATVLNAGLAIDPTDSETLYLAIDAGVYKSADAAGSWEPLPVLAFSFSSVAIDPQTPTTVYAGSYLEGLYKTEDGGRSWVRLDSPESGFFDEDLMSLAIDPLDPVKVYSGVRGAGIFRSLDEGFSWALATEGLAALQACCVVVDPDTPSTLYAGSGVGGFGGGGVWKSVDGGQTWEPRSTGLASLNIEDLEVDPEESAISYLGTRTAGVYKSANGAASWVPVNDGIVDMHIESLAIDPSTPETIYAGGVEDLYKTINGAGDWFLADAGLTGEFVFDIAIDPQVTATLYAATVGGAFKSTTGGASWFHLEGLANPFVDTIAVDPNAPTTVYADGSVAKSIDGGMNWVNGPPAGNVRLVEVDPADSQTLYAQVSFEGLYRSLDGGRNWEPFNDGFANVAVQAIAFDPNNPRRLYAATKGGVYEILVGGLFEDGFESGDTSAWDQAVQ